MRAGLIILFFLTLIGGYLILHKSSVTVDSTPSNTIISHLKAVFQNDTKIVINDVKYIANKTHLTQVYNFASTAVSDVLHPIRTVENIALSLVDTAEDIVEWEANSVLHFVLPSVNVSNLTTLTLGTFSRLVNTSLVQAVLKDTNTLQYVNFTVPLLKCYEHKINQYDWNCCEKDNNTVECCTFLPPKCNFTKPLLPVLSTGSIWFPSTWLNFFIPTPVRTILPSYILPLDILKYAPSTIGVNCPTGYISWVYPANCVPGEICPYPLYIQYLCASCSSEHKCVTSSASNLDSALINATTNLDVQCHDTSL
jgi:hypothetical protein